MKNNGRDTKSPALRPPRDDRFLSVVIPCYNEEKVIPGTLARVASFLKAGGFKYEIIVVDDHSSDSTTEIVRGFMKNDRSITVFVNERNMGKGYSVRRGFLAAKGGRVFFTDADLSAPIEEIGKLLRWLENGYDVAIGSRSVAGSEVSVSQPVWREMMGKTFNIFVRAFAVSGIRDTQCGFKLFSREAAGRVFPLLTINGFSFDVEALYLASKFGYRIKEVPVKWANRKESRVNPLVHPLQMLRDLLRIRLLDLMGRYR